MQSSLVLKSLLAVSALVGTVALASSANGPSTSVLPSSASLVRRSDVPTQPQSLVRRGRKDDKKHQGGGKRRNKQNSRMDATADQSTEPVA
ncbi:hypothetical protein H4R33_007125 [Dimargaris cristalligena]|nr:hypothetical protein H4R33_007125 [Dimargaris cristalligena]